MAIATIHPMYAGDDIVADTDQGDILLYVALNDETGDALCADLTEDGVKRTCEELGFSPVPCQDVYEQPRGERWRRRQ